ncbi:MAG: hypothetical protein SNJ72_11075, partial [Fimbriimonadales bacterium]
MGHGSEPSGEPLTFAEAVRMLVGFLKGLLMTATLYAVASVGFHWLMGVPLFWLTGLMAGLLYAVPYVGLLVVMVLAGGLVVL